MTHYGVKIVNYTFTFEVYGSWEKTARGIELWYSEFYTDINQAYVAAGKLSAIPGCYHCVEERP